MPADRLFHGQPAFDLGLVHSMGDHVGDDVYGGQRADVRFAELRVGATRHFRDADIGSLAVIGGVSLWDVETGDGARLVGTGIRLYGAVTFALATFPRTTFLTEFDAAPRVTSSTDVSLDSRIGWGIRYHPFRALDLDLVVRNPLDTDLSGTTVMVRLSTALDVPR